MYFVAQFQSLECFFLLDRKRVEWQEGVVILRLSWLLVVIQEGWCFFTRKKWRHNAFAHASVSPFSTLYFFLALTRAITQLYFTNVMCVFVWTWCFVVIETGKMMMWLLEVRNRLNHSNFHLMSSVCFFFLFLFLF